MADAGEGLDANPDPNPNPTGEGLEVALAVAREWLVEKGWNESHYSIAASKVQACPEGKKEKKSCCASSPSPLCQDSSVSM